MKRTVKVVFEIDTESVGAPGMIVKKDKRKAIRIRVQPPAGFSTQECLPVLLHEMGHLTGFLLGTPAQRGDPRNPQNSVIFYTVSAIHAAEIEAWTLAQKIFQMSRKESLDAYGVKPTDARRKRRKNPR